jgi:hypothetical protein
MMKAPVRSLSILPVSRLMGLSKFPVLGLAIVFNLLLVTGTVAQGRLVLNGGTINLNQGAYLVLDNSASNAITRSSGYIISEGENNRIKWNIGTTTGTYTIPWGYSSSYIPLTFTKAAGSGGGYFLFSTYHTGSNNISQLPTGVSHINGASGSDNSLFVSDRFWQINAQGYTAKPALSNVVFTYLDSENNSPNTISEGLLRAKRYNSTLSSWSDCLPSSTVNSASNTLTIASIEDYNLHAWWMLGTLSTNRYWVAPSNSNSNTSINWAETAGGAGNAGVPTIGDVIIFDGTSDFNCVLDSDLSASSIIVSPGFSGIITQGSNAIAVAGNATFSGGTFVGGPADLTVGGNVTVSGTSFTAPSAILDIKGNFALTSGTFTHNNGTVKFSGTGGMQTITSSSALTFNNITATNTSASPGVSVQSNENMKGVLTLGSNVNFDADGSSNTAILKLLSTGDNPTQDAAVGILPSGAQVSGKVTVQRFMSKEGFNSNKVYRYISSPIQNATVADLQQEIPITGTFTGRSTCSGCVATSPSLYSYSEPIVTDSDLNGVANLHDGFVDFPDVSNIEVFQIGRGYALYVRGNLLPSTSWDLRGPINMANGTPINFPITYTSSGSIENDGWNLVGNPFPSTIDWNSSNGWTKVNLETTIYIGDNSSATGHQFATWNGVIGTNGGSQYVATGQAFWVKANGNGSPALIADESVKAAGTQTTFLRQEKPTNLIRIIASKGTSRDETVIHFREDATVAFDGHADARKMANTSLNIASKIEGGNLLAINSLPFLNCNTAVELSLSEVTPGSYKLAFSEYESLPNDISITLKDQYLDSTINVKNGSYSFSVTSAPASYGASRFKLEFHSVPINSELVAAAADVCDGNDAIISIKSSQPGVSYTAVIDNREIPSSTEAGVTTITIPKSQLSTGENSIQIRSSSAYCNNVVINTVQVTSHELLTPVVQPGATCGTGSLVLTASGELEDGLYNWYEEITSVLPIEGQHMNTFSTPIIKKSKTYYVAAINSLGCEGERIPVTATIINIDAVSITPTAFTLSSSYETGNQWYLNGEKIEGLTTQTIEPSQSGLYKIEVHANGCLTVSEIDFTVTRKPIIPVQPDTVETEQGNSIENVEKPITNSPEITGVDAIVISPNPIRETATIEIPRNFQDISKISVMNGVGQLVGYVLLDENSKMKTGTIHLDGQPSGIYIIRIVTNAGVFERKVIKL